MKKNALLLIFLILLALISTTAIAQTPSLEPVISPESEPTIQPSPSPDPSPSSSTAPTPSPSEQPSPVPEPSPSNEPSPTASPTTTPSLLNKLGRSLFSTTSVTSLADITEVTTGAPPTFAGSEPVTFTVKFEETTLVVTPTEQAGEVVQPIPSASPLSWLKRYLPIARADTPVNVTATITNLGGHSLEVTPVFTTTAEGVQVSAPAPTSFLAGKYTLNLTLTQDTTTLTASQDFTWGVLALNMKQSSYQPEEAVDLGLAVLNDHGKTVCDAKLAITITPPQGETTTLSTEHDDITVSEECADKSVTIQPDYQASYDGANTTGTYTVDVTATTENGTRTLTDSFIVEQDPLFHTQRRTATRIYPIVDYTVRLIITTKEAFTGKITESIPEDFEITEVSDGGQAGEQAIVWDNVSIKPDQPLTLTYTYNAPDISPQFYVMGPLVLSPPTGLSDEASAEAEGGEEEGEGGWVEPRAWQIAADAAFNDFITGDWNVGLTWGGGCAVSCTEGTDYPGASDTATIDSATVTLTATHSVDDLTLASGGTLTAGSNTLRVQGTWNNTGGTFNANTGTVLFNAPSTSETITSNSQSFNNVTLNDGLVGYWKLDEGTGTSTTSDSSGYGNTGTLTNVDSGDWSTSTKADVNFTNNSALNLDTDPEYISIADSPSLDLTASITISAWIRPDTRGNDPIVYKRQANSNTTNYAFRIDDSSPSDELDFYYYDGSGYHTYTTSSNSLVSDSWQHVAVSYTFGTGSSMAIYLNGALQSGSWVSGTGNAATVANNIAVQVGYYDHTTDEIFDGHLDDIRLYNRALTQQEIQALALGNQPHTSSSTFTLEDTLDVDGNLLLNSGILDTKSGEDNAITLAGTWENNGGKFTPRSNTTTLNGTSTGKELQSGGNSFNSLTVSGSGGGWTLQDRLDVNGTYTQSNGTIDTSTSNYALHAADWDQTGSTFTANSSSLTVDGTSSTAINTDDSVSTVQIEDPTESGLVGYWKFDEGQGTSAADVSGNSNTGTLTNTPLWSETVGTTTFDNPYAIDFDGTNDYVSVSDNSGLGVTQTTISAWIKPDAWEDGAPIFNRRTGANVGGVTLEMGDTAGKIHWYAYIGGSWRVQTTTGWSTGSWQHIAVTYNGSTMRTYRNGSEVGTPTSISGSINNPASPSVVIGLNIVTPTGYYNGHLDDVRIYNRALSDAEVTNLANGKYADGDNSTATFTLNTALQADTEVYLQSGILDASASNCSGNSCNITVGNGQSQGYWYNYSGASSFTPGTGNVWFKGTDASISGSTTFFNLTIADTSDDGTSTSYSIEDDTTQTINGTLSLNGTDGDDLLVLTALNSTSAFTLDVVGHPPLVNYADISYANASTHDITCTNCTNNGNDDGDTSPHWVFTTEPASNQYLRHGQYWSRIVEKVFQW